MCANRNKKVMPYITLEDGTKVKISQESYDALRSVKKKRWRGKRSEQVYWFIEDDGNMSWIMDEGDEEDNSRYKIGNYFENAEQTETVRDKIQALTNIWDWWRENSGFEPDWKENKEMKYYIYFTFLDEEFEAEGTGIYGYNSFLPYFERQETAEKCITDCKKDLEIIWGINND